MAKAALDATSTRKKLQDHHTPKDVLVSVDSVEKSTTHSIYKCTNQYTAMRTSWWIDIGSSDRLTLWNYWPFGTKINTSSNKFQFFRWWSNVDSRIRVLICNKQAHVLEGMMSKTDKPLWFCQCWWRWGHHQRSVWLRQRGRWVCSSCPSRFGRTGLRWSPQGVPHTFSRTWSKQKVVNIKYYLVKALCSQFDRSGGCATYR